MMISARYDDITDVLYVASRKVKAFGDESPDGLIVRYEYGTKDACGVTVLDFDHRWGDKERELAQRIAELLHAPFHDVVKAIGVAKAH